MSLTERERKNIEGSTLLLDEASALLPWKHPARAALRTIVQALLDEVETKPHSFTPSKASRTRCATCLGTADDHLAESLAASLAPRLEVVR